METIRWLEKDGTVAQRPIGPDMLADIPDMLGWVEDDIAALAIRKLADVWARERAELQHRRVHVET